MVVMHASLTAAPGTPDAGGLNASVLNTAFELAKNDVEVDLLARAVAAPGTTVLAPGVRLFEIAAGGRGRIGADRLAEVTDEFGEGVAARARTNQGYDLVHAHHWRSGIAALPVALELGLPFVQSFHSLAAMKNRSRAAGQPTQPPLRLRSETYLAQQADAVIAASAAEVSSLLDSVGATAGKVWVVPPGVDTEVFTPARAISEGVVRGQLGIAAERPIVVVVGRVHPHNGQELAVQAIAAIAGERPVLVIAGEPMRGAERHAEALHEAVGSDIVFTGALSREELADLFATAALTLAPSQSETSGLAALESAASGTPVLAGLALARTGVVEEGVSGVVLASRDPAEWARAVTALLDDPILLGELSASARAYARDFSWAASAAALLGVYASVLPNS